MDRLVLLGLNHTTAPLELREKLAFSPKRQRAALESFRARFTGCEALLLSTCNRVELYTAGIQNETPAFDELLRFVADFHDVDPQLLSPQLYRNAEREAVEHLFTVAASLDSMVLGETQILAQVKQCYDVARELETAGPMLNPLLQRALAVGKEVMATTGLGGGHLSVAGVAVDYARKIFETFSDKTVLSVGAGEMATLVLRHFAELKPKRLIVCNRDVEKGRALAEESGGEHIAFDQLDEALAQADVVISSTGAPHVIIQRDQMAAALKRRRYRPVFMIDLAVPRDIDASVGRLEHVFLYNIDDLQQVVAATQAHRCEAVSAARKIVAKHVDEFFAWHRQRALGPAIERLYGRYHLLAKHELERTLHKLPNISADERAHLDDLARRIVNKLLHDPMRTLRHSEGSHDLTPMYLHALEKLFALDKPDCSEPHESTPDNK